MNAGKHAMKILRSDPIRMRSAGVSQIWQVVFLRSILGISYTSFTVCVIPGVI
jgi:hypothetical protein